MRNLASLKEKRDKFPGNMAGMDMRNNQLLVISRIGDHLRIYIKRRLLFANERAGKEEVVKVLLGPVSGR